METTIIPRVVYFDGCCEPNPGGWMGYAWVALAADGSEIAHQGSAKPAAPENTNNRAEYLALLSALLWLREQGHRGVLVRGDSQLVIRQMEGAWRCGAENLLPLYEHAQRLALTTRATFEWVRGPINHRADGYSRAQLPPAWRRAS